MPILIQAERRIDYLTEGAGPTVVLVHSSVSGNRQWRALIRMLSASHQVIAPNLIGYGDTTPWGEARPQALDDQVAVLEPFIDPAATGTTLIGHSFGASVALRAALVFRERISHLVLIEPNPFALLRHFGRVEAMEEALSLRDFIKLRGGAGDWKEVSEKFADYWNGPGTWDAMPAERRTTFMGAMPPNFHEWDAVMNDESFFTDLPLVEASTLVVVARDTKRPIAEIVDLMQEIVPHWQFAFLPEGGHMAPFTRPDLVNPLIADWLRMAQLTDG